MGLCGSTQRVAPDAKALSAVQVKEAMLKPVTPAPAVATLKTAPPAAVAPAPDAAGFRERRLSKDKHALSQTSAAAREAETSASELRRRRLTNVRCDRSIRNSPRPSQGACAEPRALRVPAARTTRARCVRRFAGGRRRARVERGGCRGARGGTRGIGGAIRRAIRRAIWRAIRRGARRQGALGRQGV